MPLYQCSLKFYLLVESGRIMRPNEVGAHDSNVCDSLLRRYAKYQREVDECHATKNFDFANYFGIYTLYMYYFYLFHC